MSIPKIIFINCINTPPNYTSNNMIAITEGGDNIHVSKKDTPTMYPVTMSNNIEARLPDESTIGSSHIATLQLPGLSKKAR